MTLLTTWNIVSQRDKLEKFGRWRIRSSSIEFPRDSAREFHGGYASVSRAVLVIHSDVKCQDNDSAEGENGEGQEKVNRDGVQKSSTQTFERKVGC